MPNNPPPAEPTTNTAPGAAVDALLTQLRDALRQAIGRRLAWQAAAAVGFLIWIGLILDRWFEPTASVRAAVGLVVLIGAVAWFAMIVAPRLWRRLSDRDLLTLLHHRHPKETNLLATALDLRSQPSPPNQKLAAEAIATADRSARSLDHVRLDRPTSTMGLAWFASAALSGALLLGIARPDLAHCFAKRFALSERPWPRRVQLVAEGFAFDEATGEWSLIAPRGEPLEFAVLAETDPEHPLPRTVWARGGVNGRRELTTFTRVGQPLAGDNKQQRFRRRIERLDADQTLVVSGGDARLRLRILAAERPRLIETRIACQPPAYRSTPPFTVEPTTLTPLPEGSRLTLSTAATKPIASVEARLTGNDTARLIDAVIGDDGLSLTLDLPRLVASHVVSLEVIDTEGLGSTPLEIPVEIALDAPPSVRLILDGVGRSITRDARLPVVAEVDDDHGLANVSLRVSHEESEPVTLNMAPPITLPGTANGAADLLTLRSAGATNSLSVEPGDRLTLTAAATDRYDLAKRPATLSQPIVLEVVTPAELLARLGDAQRELRRGVDSLLADVERLEYELDLGKRRFTQDDPPTAANLRRWASERLLDARKASSGIVQIADRAEGLRRQVVNNRLDQPALVDRLATAVVSPLKRVTDRDLKTTRESLTETDPTAVETTLPEAFNATRRAAERLQKVAASLDSQQTYNEVVSLLRGLIREQRTVNEKTTRQEAEDARSLLLD